MANTAAKLFMAYLESKETHAKYVNDEESVVRVGWNLENTKLNIYFFFGDDGKDVHLIGDGFCKAPENKQDAILKAVNECNKKFRWMKFVLKEEGEVEVEDDAVIQLDTCAEECFELMVRMCSIVDEAYPILMKSIWS